MDEFTKKLVARTEQIERERAAEAAREAEVAESLADGRVETDLANALAVFVLGPLSGALRQADPQAFAQADAALRRWMDE